MAGVFFDPSAGLALVMDDQSIYQGLLRSFIDHHQDLAQRIDRLVERHDRPELVRFCHTTKSTSGYVGSSLVQQQARSVELQLKSSTRSITAAEKEALANLVQDLLRLVEAAENYLAAHGSDLSSRVASNPQTGPASSDNSSHPDLEQDTIVWQQLRHSLDAHDPKISRRLLSQLLAQTGQETDRAILLQIQSHLGQYQYAKACQLIDPILAQRKHTP
ncbi:MAG: Hpt domain-containing protein [Clostridia bacterium]|nr:Hpt domain-containing protein [Clostridia bacterium]